MRYRKMNPIPLIATLLVVAITVFAVMTVFYVRLRNATNAATAISIKVTSETTTVATSIAEETTTAAETTVTSTSTEVTTVKATPSPMPEITPEASPTPEVKAVNLEHPYLLEVNKAAQVVTIYTLDINGQYTVPVRYMICSTGARNNTPEGLWRLKTQYRWRLMLDGDYAQYASRITGNFLIHSLTYTKADINSLTSAAEYNNLGTPASMGCVRLQAADAKWVYDNMKPGSYVRIISGQPMDEIKKTLVPDTLASGTKADPSDPELTNPITVKGYAILNTPYPGVTPAPMTERLSDEVATKSTTTAARETAAPATTPASTAEPEPDATSSTTVTEPTTSVTEPATAATTAAVES